MAYDSASQFLSNTMFNGIQSFIGNAIANLVQWIANANTAIASFFGDLGNRIGSFFGSLYSHSADTARLCLVSSWGVFGEGRGRSQPAPIRTASTR